MDQQTLQEHIQKALGAITHPRWYETERGFQGALLAELSHSIPQQLLPAGVIIEQEYQKTLAQHGLTIRPDIIIHEPFDAARHKSPRDGNIAVIELKLKATKKEAGEDFESLLKMMALLDYPVAVFINIGSQETYADLIPQSAKGRITSFAISLIEGAVQVIQAI